MNKKLAFSAIGKPIKAMANEYSPDGWVLIKVIGSDPHYKVFGSWRGGFADGDSWRMNSGVTSVTEEKDHFIFSSFSGSQYVCHKETYGLLGSYCSSVLKNFCNSSDSLSFLQEMPENIIEMDWIIK